MHNKIQVQLQCSSGPHLQAAVGWSLSQKAVDIMGDLLSGYSKCFYFYDQEIAKLIYR